MTTAKITWHICSRSTKEIRVVSLMSNGTLECTCPHFIAGEKACYHIRMVKRQICATHIKQHSGGNGDGFVDDSKFFERDDSQRPKKKDGPHDGDQGDYKRYMEFDEE